MSPIFSIPDSVRVLDSHTAGEPTRVLLPGTLNLGSGPLAERLQRFRNGYDRFRTAVLAEPRGSDVIVGALLVPPVDPASAAAVLFFNDVGYLGMCGHGTIGVVHTLAHLGHIGPGRHTLETPVGPVCAELHANGSVSVANVASYRYRHAVTLQVPGYGAITGDIAYGGNWFFLIGQHPFALHLSQRDTLTRATTAIREALRAQGITGADGAEIDHIELFGAPHDAANSARNFVLCPGAAFDRSPCGTGTSAKLACLHAEGKLAPGYTWRQEGILGTVFEGTIAATDGARIHPVIRGRAWLTADTTLHFATDDPFREGIPF